MKITIESSVESLGSYANPHNLQAMGWTHRQIDAAVRRGTLRWLHGGNLEVISPDSRGTRAPSSTGVSHARKKQPALTRRGDPTGVYGGPSPRDPLDEYTAHNLTGDDLALALQLGFNKRDIERALSTLRGTSDDWDALESIAEALEEHRLR